VSSAIEPAVAIPVATRRERTKANQFSRIEALVRPGIDSRPAFRMVARATRSGLGPARGGARGGFARARRAVSPRRRTSFTKANQNLAFAHRSRRAVCLARRRCAARFRLPVHHRAAR